MKRLALQRSAILAIVSTLAGGQIAAAQQPGPSPGLATTLLEHLQTSTVIEYATLIVAMVTLLIAIFIPALGFLEWRRFVKLKNELVVQRRRLEKERHILQTKIDAFTAQIESQQQRLVANQRFLDAVLSHYSDLLVGIIEGFGSALQPEQARKLSSLIFEAEAAVDLFHPDSEEVVKALWRLEQIGADAAVPWLVRLKEDPYASKKIGIRATEVLAQVRDRLRREQTLQP